MGKLIQLELKMCAMSKEDLKPLVSIAKSYIDDLVLDCGSRGLNCPLGTISASIDVVPESLKAPHPTQPPTTPFNPITFLDAMAVDAVQRAERLESRAAKTFTANDADETREVAARYRLRAEAYKIAALEMKLEMEKRGLNQ